MNIIPAQSATSTQAYGLVRDLQHYFVTKLDGLSDTFGKAQHAEAVTWYRDDGRHGGGVRLEGRDESIFNRASVNISQVHYDDLPEKQLAAANAISTIIHPQNPHAPSMHMHISWTEMRSGKGYWRMMADLNPSIENQDHTQIFTQALQKASGDLFKQAAAQGNRYFNIPALGRHRGVSHFYLENFNSGDARSDSALAIKLGEAVIDTYIDIVSQSLTCKVSQSDERAQLDYHTLYLFQVLTLDRGTTSGLLVHDQNDIGILGSIPKYIDSELLASWETRAVHPQDALVRDLVACLGSGQNVLVDETMKVKLANAVRTHYKRYPEALSMQASGDVSVPTVQNHR
jgi:coproporphyrinogen III oxidase